MCKDKIFFSAPFYMWTLYFFFIFNIFFDWCVVTGDLFVVGGYYSVKKLHSERSRNEWPVPNCLAVVGGIVGSSGAQPRGARLWGWLAITRAAALEYPAPLHKHLKRSEIDTTTDASQTVFGTSRFIRESGLWNLPLCKNTIVNGLDPRLSWSSLRISNFVVPYQKL